MALDNREGDMIQDAGHVDSQTVSLTGPRPRRSRTPSSSVRRNLQWSTGVRTTLSADHRLETARWIAA